MKSYNSIFSLRLDSERATIAVISHNEVCTENINNTVSEQSVPRMRVRNSLSDLHLWIWCETNKAGCFLETFLPAMDRWCTRTKKMYESASQCNSCSIYCIAQRNLICRKSVWAIWVDLIKALELVDAGHCYWRMYGLLWCLWAGWQKSDNSTRAKKNKLMK